MKLLHEIQKEAVDGKADLATLLRKCRVLAARLKNDEFKNWVQYELDGYPPDAELPEYRTMNAQSFGNFAGAFGSGLQNAPIPMLCIPKKFHDFINTVEFRDGIGSLQDLVPHNEGGILQEQWPADLVAIVARNIYRDMTLFHAWKLISPASVIGIIETVRNRILNFVLEIESAAPDAGETTSPPALTPEQVGSVFNTYIMGNVGNVASGSSHVEQHATVTINQGDFDSLSKFLKSLGVDESDVAELRHAIEAEPTVMKTGFGKRVAVWIGGMVAKSAQGLWQVATTTASAVLTQAISQYYGM